MARREITPERYAALLKDVAVVAEPWAGSSYYEDAERSTANFWADGSAFRSLFDRLNRGVLVDLAAGHGRHTAEAAKLAPRVYALDVLEENVAFCRARLADLPHVTCLRNDGFSFQPLEADTATGIYCYDAMVHFSPGIVEAYLQDAQRVLKPGGRGLFHHSNYPAPLDRHYGQNPHARNHMTQALFASLARDAGLTVIESQVMDWGREKALDCLTLVAKRA